MRWGRMMATVSFIPPTCLGIDESHLVSVRGLWRGKGQVSMAGFFSRVDEEGWQDKSRQEASQYVSGLCPEGISFMAL